MTTAEHSDSSETPQQPNVQTEASASDSAWQKPSPPQSAPAPSQTVEAPDAAESESQPQDSYFDTSWAGPADSSAAGRPEGASHEAVRDAVAPPKSRVKLLLLLGLIVAGGATAWSFVIEPYFMRGLPTWTESYVPPDAIMIGSINVADIRTSDLYSDLKTMTKGMNLTPQGPAASRNMSTAIDGDDVAEVFFTFGQDGAGPWILIATKTTTDIDIAKAVPPNAVAKKTSSGVEYREIPITPEALGAAKGMGAGSAGGFPMAGNPVAALAQFGRTLYIAKPNTHTFCISNRLSRLTAALDRTATQKKHELDARSKEILRHVSSEDHFIVMNKMPVPGMSQRFGMGFSMNGALKTKIVVSFPKSKDAELMEEQISESLKQVKEQLGSKKAIPFMPGSMKDTAENIIESLSLSRSGSNLIITASATNEDIRKLVTAIKAALPGMLQQAMAGGMAQGGQPQMQWRR